MKYFIDTEFIEGKQYIRIPFTNIKIGETKPTIDLISIGIVSEDGREYYAISKDFNLKEAWNRYDVENYDRQNNLLSIPRKTYWIRENILLLIFNELKSRVVQKLDFTYKNLYKLIKMFGKSNEEIAFQIKKFVGFPSYFPNNPIMKNCETTKPEFYAYYASYDWVVFCWLFGRMVNLPKGFPMYCRDLKQMLDEKRKTYTILKDKKLSLGFKGVLPEDNIEFHPSFPTQKNEHNALADARWNKKLYEFLINL